MADNINLSIGFNTKEAQQEITALKNTLTQTKNEFKLTDATLKTTGSSLDKLNNKYQSLSKQVSQQSEITAKYKQAVEQASKMQEAARQRLEKANAAYEEGKKSLKGNSDELKKLEDEVKKAQKAVKTAESDFDKFSRGLTRSQLAEANLRNSLKQTSDELQKQSKFIAQVKDNYDKLQEKTEGVQKGMTATGKVLTAGVTTPIVALAGYAVNSMNKVDEGLDTVMTKTGATGQEAKELQSVYMEVAKTVPAAYGDIGASVGEINTRLGFTGGLLKTASTDFLKFAKVNGTDVNTSVQLVTRAMGDASIPAEEYKSVLDSITVAGQKSGISVDTLATNLAKYGAPMRALGIDTKNAIALFAGWEKAGVNTEIAFSGMKKAISNWGSEGKDSRTEFAKTLEEIKNAPDIAAATTKAIEIFGSKAGPDLADAIQGGRFEVEQYLDALSKADGAVDNTYGMIVDEVDDTQLAIQNLEVGFHDLGESIAKNVGPVALDVAEDIGTLVGKFGELDSGTQKNILKFALLAAAIGPLLSIGSKGISVVNGGIAAVKTITGLLSGATAATTAAGTAASAAGTATAAAAGTAVSAAAPVVLAIAGITAAMVVGQKAYDAWYDSQYRWSEGMTESVQKVQEQAERYKELSGFQKEISDLRLIINSDKSSQDELEAAKTRLEEIKKILEEKYELNIEVNDDELEKEVEEKAHLSRNDLVRDSSQYKQSLTVDYESFQSNESTLTSKRQELDSIKDTQVAYSDLSATLTDLRDSYTEGKITLSDYMTESNKALKTAQDLGVKIATSTNRQGQHTYLDAIETAEEVNTAINAANINYSQLEDRATQLKTEIDDLDASAQEYVDTAKAYADTYSELLKTDTANQDGEKVQKDLEEMSYAVQKAGLDLDEYAKKAALAMNGVDSLDTAWQQAANGDGRALDGIVNDYIRSMKEFGATAEEAGIGGALIKEGFKSLNEAASSEGGLNKVAESFKEITGQSELTGEQFTKLAQEIGLLPKDTKIELNAEGDFELVDTVDSKVKELAGETFAIKFDTEGDTKKLDDADEKVKDLANKKCVITLDADDKPAIATIDGLDYQIENYDNTTGKATLVAENGEAVAVIDLTTGKISEIPEEHDTEITATDNTGPAVKSAQDNINGLKDKTVTITVKTVEIGGISQNSPAAKFGNTGYFVKENAKGTQDFEGGLAMINDEKGIADPRELVEHKGKYYLFEGRNVVLNLDKHDKVFTAKQTQAMLKDIPHFAGGVNNEAFTAAKDDFEYRQKTSIVTDEEALLWWKNVLEEYAADAEVVKEANIEIYELTNKINDDKIKEYKDRIKEQESASKDWIDYEVKMNNLSIEEQIAAYGRMDQNYLNTLTEMTENTEMTAEELEEVWSEYYETIRDHEMEVAELKKKNLEQQNQLSLDYIAERTYYNDWDKFSDSPEEAYERIKERNLNALNNGDITTEEYNANMTEAGQKLYEGRLENSKKYLELQRKYGNISDEEYRAGLQRVLDYTKQYYESGMISGKYYYEALDEANGNLFDNMSATLENYVNEYYEAQQQMLSDKKAAIEAEYAAIEAAETKEEREKELSQLKAEYEKYKNAVTIDGKKKLQEIQDNIDSLKKEEEQEAREAEKEARLAEVEKEGELLQAEQENALKGISKYTAQALGIIEGGNTEMTERFNKVVSTYNQQQEQLATSGYNTISKIVDLTNAKLAEIGTNIPYGINENNKQYTVTVTQTFNNTISDETTAMIYGKYAGSSVRRGFSEEFEGVK